MITLITESMLTLGISSLKDTAEIVGYVVGIGGGISGVYFGAKKYVFTPLYTYFTKISSSLDQISSINVKITNIDKELTTNGGFSIKDAVIRMDKNLFLLEERQKALLSSSKEVCYFETDGHGAITSVNRYFQRLTNRALEELLGFGWLNIVEKSQREEVRKEWTRCVSNVEEYSGIFFIENVDGDKFQVKLEAYPMKNKDSTLAGYIALMKPINKESASKNGRS